MKSQAGKRAQPETERRVGQPRLLIDVERQRHRGKKVELREPGAQLKRVGGARLDGQITHRN
jgi:hypothetical protein